MPSSPRAFGIGVGDTITVNVLGRDIEARIASLRRIEWQTLSINFVFVFSPGLLDKAPHTFLATVKATPEAEEEIFEDVTDRFPNVTVVRIRMPCQTAVGRAGQYRAGVRVIGLLSILAGMLVLAGAMLATQRRRIHEAVVMKVLGATRARIAGTFAWEFATLGLATALAALAVGRPGGLSGGPQPHESRLDLPAERRRGGRGRRDGPDPGLRAGRHLGGPAAAAAWRCCGTNECMFT